LDTKRLINRTVYSGATFPESLTLQNPTARIGCIVGATARGNAAFPIHELKINAAIQGLIAIGATLWLLDAPDRIWPWFALGWACLVALMNAAIEIQEGTIGSAAAFAVILGGPLAWAGWAVQPRGYAILGWICIGFAALLVVAVIVRCILAAWPRSSNP
jgi:hypothetical protein